MVDLSEKMIEKKCSVQYNKINITSPERVIVENIISQDMIINLGFASIDNHILLDYIHILLLNPMIYQTNKSGNFIFV